MLLNHDKELLEIEDCEGETPLACAAASGLLDIVRFLLERGANVHAATQSGRTVLMAACDYGQLEIMRLLLAAGAGVHALDRDRKNALHCAASSQSSFTMGTTAESAAVVRELILQHNADMFAVDKKGNTPFDVACLSSSTRAAANAFIELYANKLTAGHGQLAIHALLRTAKYSFPENRAFHPPLSPPIQIHTPMGKLTLKHWRTLLQALGMNLIRNRDDNGKLPIHIACRTKAPVEVLALLSEEDSASLHVADSNGVLPLHDCCSGAVDDTSVRFLVEQGGVGTLAARDHQGALPLHYLCASTNSPLRTVQYLIQSFPGSVAVQTNDQLYPFMSAACESSAASLSVVYVIVRASAALVIAKNSTMNRRT